MTNLFLILMLAMVPQGVGSGPSQRVAQEGTSAPTPVTGLFLIPPKIPDCKTKEEADQALADKRAGEWEKCDPERYNRAHSGN